MPPLICVVPVGSVVRLARAVTPPTAPSNSVTPPVLSVSAAGPSTVVEKRSLPLAPLPVLVRMVSCVTVVLNV